ncbi:MAG: 5-methyltetrahydrofolate--homocysteine methyltransferase [Prevotellaceae bacterium]|jgi:5-methyltetrahydrofolate--homocysteine methyltransferase|nr:5-methyltetrahydrofolate--homocysteine methyltransferase [Prevotellaceae bacterium]
MGEKHYFQIPVSEALPLIQWLFFFKAWRLTGAFSSEKEAQKEQIKREANELLGKIIKDNLLQINAFVGIFPARSDDEDICICVENQEIRLPVLRQQQPASDGFCYSLSDFLKPKDDHAGVFAVTVAGAEKMAEEFQNAGDSYNSILIKTLADRLAEAASQYLHYKVRTEIWAYAQNESFDIARLLKDDYQGIRPAVGYPSLPDQSIIFDLDKIINFNKLDIKLTENGAMIPNASICGLYFAHPSAKYFMVGKIDTTQVADYARRRGKTLDEMRKYLTVNL